MPLASQRTQLLAARLPEPAAAYSFTTIDGASSTMFDGAVTPDDSGRGNDLIGNRGKWLYRGPGDAAVSGDEAYGGAGFRCLYPSPQVITQFTVMAWVKYTNKGDWSQFARVAYGPSHASWWLQVSNSGYLEAYREPDTTGAWSELWGPLLTEDTWYHAAFTQSSTGGTLYLNGVQVAGDANGAGTYTFTGTFLDTACATQGSTKTYIDDLRIYNKALTAAQITQLMSMPVKPEIVDMPNPLVAYGFGEGSGATSADLSGNGHTLSIPDVAMWQPGHEGGYALQSLNSSQIASVSDPGYAIKPITAITLMVWVYKTPDWGTGSMWGPVISKTHAATGDTATIYTHDGGNNPGFHITTTGDNVVGVQSNGVPGVSDTGWQHLAGTYDGSYVKFYVNGILQGVVSHSGDLEYHDAYPWQVAGASYWSEEAGATVDDVRIYDVALTQTQIQTAMLQSL